MNQENPTTKDLMNYMKELPTTKDLMELMKGWKAEMSQLVDRSTAAEIRLDDHDSAIAKLQKD